jgi:hypothetical protein
VIEGTGEVPDVCRDLFFGPRLLPSNAPAGFHQRFFEFTDVREKKGVRRALRIVRAARRCRNLDRSHSCHPKELYEVRTIRAHDWLGKQMEERSRFLFAVGPRPRKSRQ